MERLRQKRPRFVLNSEDYGKLREQVLSRDGWRCQACGSTSNLQVHHLVPRSKLGHDLPDNLMTVCCKCHIKLHRP